MINNKAYHILKQSYFNKTVSHSYILSGQVGAFVKNTAFEFVKLLNCSEQLNAPCYKCKNCLSINNQNSIDYYFISDDTKINVETIRNIQDFIKYGPTQNNYLVVVFANFNNISIEASNAFLKTLEEPIEKVMFILMTKNILDVLPTIKSRSQIINLTTISDNDISNFLKTFSETEQQNILMKNNHNLELIKYYLEDPEILENLDYQSIQEILNYNEIEKMNMAEKIAKKNKEQINIIFKLWLKELLNEPLKNKIRLEKIIAKTLQMKYNLNLRLHLENLLLNLN